MGFRFVHTADLHLDSPLRSLALRDPALAELVGEASRSALARIVDLCLEERVDALLIAGDLYDGSQTSMKPAMFLAGQLKRLVDGAVQAFIVRGNHDAASRITRELQLPEGVTVFGGRAGSRTVRSRDGSSEVRIHGVSFADPHSQASLLPKFQAPSEGVFNIGIMHTSLDGSPDHDVYAPCAARDLQASGFRYWALGHIHARSVSDDGRCAIVMPGMPQGRDIGETGGKSATLASVADDGSLTLEMRATCLARFERVDVNLDGIAAWREAVDLIGQAVRAARAKVDAPHLIVRPRLAGASPLAWRIRRDGDLVLAEAMREAADAGRTFIDAIDNATLAAADGRSRNGDAISELHRLIAADVRASPPFRERVVRLAGELRAQMPAECRNAFGDDAADLAAIVDRAIAEGGDDIVARLRGRLEADAA